MPDRVLLKIKVLVDLILLELQVGLLAREAVLLARLIRRTRAHCDSSRRADVNIMLGAIEFFVG